MLIASMIVRVLPESAEDIALQLKKIPNVSTHGIYKEEYIIVVLEAENERKLEDFTKYIQGEFDDIAGVYPTFVGSEDSLPEDMDLD